MREADARTPIRREDYQVPPYLIDTIELELRADPVDTRVRGTLAVRRNPDGAGGPLRLDGRELELESIHLDGRSLAPDRYRVDDEGLVIDRVPERFELVTECMIHPHLNSALEGFYQSADLLISHCEAEGFRKITYFPDRPDVMARYRVRIEADRAAYPQLLSNGNLVEHGDSDGGRHYAVWEDPFPKPSYLFAAVAGKLACLEDDFVTSDGRRVALRLYTDARNLAKLDHAMASLKRAMAWDERRFGLVYDLDVYHIVATDDFNMGAMENKSLNIFNSKFLLACPETATDIDYEAIEGVVGHEYFHNWTGNRVTCRDWFQLSLKEGLTVFRDQEFSSDMRSRAVKRIADVRALRTLQFPEDSGPMAHPVRPDSYLEINNFYTRTVYEKGAEVVRMYHTLLGEEGFQRGMRLYFERHDGQAVTCDDFRHAMADANGVDLTQFERWYSQAGTPVVAVATEHDPKRSRFTLILRQHTPPTPGQAHKLPQHIPVRLALLDRDGGELPLQLEGGAALGTEGVVELTEAEQRFVFTGIAEEPVVSVFRRFSAPVRLDYPRGREELAFLMGHERDPIGRWDASQALATEFIVEDARGLASGADHREPALYLSATRRALNDREADPALIAEALIQPDELQLAAELEPVPVIELHRARGHLGKWLGRALDRDFRTRYRELGAAEFSTAPRAVGRRALRNVCLGYLVAAGDATLAETQYRQAENMTDVLAALNALIQAQEPAAEALLADFRRRWQADPLVMGKWLMLHASDPRPGAAQRVRELMSDPVFSLRNPNKVRSLLGTFAHRNQVAFHAADGSGYELVATQVLAIDRLNPQVAAFLATAFNPWRRHDQGRQERMRSRLEAILAAPALSDDTYEIVTKALA